MVVQVKIGQLAYLLTWLGLLTKQEIMAISRIWLRLFSWKQPVLSQWVFIKNLTQISAGHSKSELDGEFTHPKNCIRKEIQRLGAIGPQEDNVVTGFSGANEIVNFLENHVLFSPQFEKQERQPDRKGYTMKRRFAKKADLSQQFGS